MQSCKQYTNLKTLKKSQQRKLQVQSQPCAKKSKIYIESNVVPNPQARILLSQRLQLCKNLCFNLQVPRVPSARFLIAFAAQFCRKECMNKGCFSLVQVTFRVSFFSLIFNLFFMFCSKFLAFFCYLCALGHFLLVVSCRPETCKNHSAHTLAVSQEMSFLPRNRKLMPETIFLVPFPFCEGF